MQKLMKNLATAVREYVDLALRGFVERLDVLERREPIKGEKGEDGKSVTVADVLPALSETVANVAKAQIESMPPVKGEPGEPGDKGEKGDKGDKGDAGVDAVPPPEAQVRAWLEAAIPDPVKGDKGDKGDAGDKGNDGTTPTDEQLRALIVPLIPKALSIEEIRAAFADQFKASVAEYALDLEKRAGDVLRSAIEKAIDRLPKPKDGRDGVDVSSFHAELLEDGRTVTFSLKAGDETFTQAICMPYPVWRETFKAGNEYKKGDSISWGGSMFIAVRDTKARPETDDSWKLVVKRGQDGKEGTRGLKGEKGNDGRNYSRALGGEF